MEKTSLYIILLRLAVGIAHAAPVLSDEWLLSMRMTSQNASAFIASGWGQQRADFKMPFAAQELQAVLDSLEHDKNLYTCEAGGHASMGHYEILRRQAPALLMAEAEQRRDFLSIAGISSNRTETPCILGEVCMILLLWIDVVPEEKVSLTILLLWEIDRLVDVPPEIAALSGWLPSLSALLLTAAGQCRGMSAVLPHNVYGELEPVCKRIVMLGQDIQRVVAEAKCNSHGLQRRASRFRQLNGDGLGVSSTEFDAESGVGGLEEVVFRLCDHHTGEFPMVRARGGTVVHVVAVSLRWRDPRIYLGPCEDGNEGDNLALELLLYSELETEEPALWGVQEQLGQSKHTRDALHCKHQHELIAEEELTCVWPSGEERPAIAGPIGHFGAVIQCGVPAGDELALAELASKGKQSVGLLLKVGSASSPLLSICANHPGPRRKLVACSKPLWNASELEGVQPYLMQDWVHYHAELGIEHFQIYDLDGSFGDTLSPLQEEGAVTHIPFFASRYGPRLHAASQDRTPFCLEPQAQDHCAWSWRGRADWVIYIESPDVFLWSSVLGGPPRKLTELLDEPWEHGEQSGAAGLSLQKERSYFAGALVRQVHFGGKPREGAQSILDRFRMREEKAWEVGHWEYPLAHPWNAGLMNVINFTGRDDGRLQFRFNPATLRADHYVDLFRARCSTCILRDEGKLSMLQAVLDRRIVATPPPGADKRHQ